MLIIFIPHVPYLKQLIRLSICTTHSSTTIHHIHFLIAGPSFESVFLYHIQSSLIRRYGCSETSQSFSALEIAIELWVAKSSPKEKSQRICIRHQAQERSAQHRHLSMFRFDASVSLVDIPLSDAKC